MHLLRVIAVSLAIAALITGAGSVSANATTPTCSPSAGLTFYPHETDESISCGGNWVATVFVSMEAGSGTYKIEVIDERCDNIGPYWHSWALGGGQYSFTDPDGCHSAHGIYEIGTSDVVKSPNGNPPNWWIEWGGWNTAAVRFPA